MEQPDIPILSYDEIRTIAERFLAEHWPSMAMPVQIEDIVEFQMKLDIIPIQNLQTAFDTDGFTYGDMSAIAVDEFIYKGRPTRYRFTLAHEIGHVVMHARHFDRNITSINAWNEFISNIPKTLYTIMEDQANRFAGAILIPKNELMKQIPMAIEEFRIKSEGIPLNEEIVSVITRGIIADVFEVSAQALEIQMQREGLDAVFFKEVKKLVDSTGR